MVPLPGVKPPREDPVPCLPHSAPNALPCCSCRISTLSSPVSLSFLHWLVFPASTQTAGQGTSHTILRGLQASGEFLTPLGSSFLALSWGSSSIPWTRSWLWLCALAMCVQGTEADPPSCLPSSPEPVRPDSGWNESRQNLHDFSCLGRGWVRIPFGCYLPCGRSHCSELGRDMQPITTGHHSPGA